MDALTNTVEKKYIHIAKTQWRDLLGCDVKKLGFADFKFAGL